MPDMQQLATQYRLCVKQNWMKIFPDKKQPHIWHISFKGAPDTHFQRGIYHLQLDLSNYPLRAPAVMMLSESGAYTTHKRICIQGITDYHPHDWTPNTNVEAVVQGIINYMSLESDRQGIGMLPLNKQACLDLAIKSVKFKCTCGADHSTLFQ